MKIIVSRLSCIWDRLSYPDRYTTADWIAFAIFGAVELAAFIGGTLLLYILLLH